jgi:hypothetical protein
MATDAKRWKMRKPLISSDREYVVVYLVMLSSQTKSDVRRETEDIHNRWYDVLCQGRVQNYDTRAKNA